MKENRQRDNFGRYFGWILLTVIVLWFLSKIYNTILVFIFALLIAYLLHPLVNVVSNIEIPGIKKKIPWFLSILIVYIFVAVIIVLAFITLVPTINEQLTKIGKEIPQLVSRFQVTLDKIELLYEQYDIPTDIKKSIDDYAQQATAKLGNMIASLFSTVGTLILNVISWVLFFIVAAIISLFMLSNTASLKRGFYTFIPPDYQDDVRDLLNEINSIFGNYIRGNLILIITDGILTYIMLFVVVGIMRIFFPAASFPYYSYALVTSVIAGSLYFIPYLGCSLAVITGLVLAYLQVPTAGYVLTIGLTVLLTNQTVDSFIRPKILGEALGVSTLFIVFAALAGSEILGVWGLLIGIPAGVMLISIIKFFYRRFLAFPVSDEILEPSGEYDSHQISKIKLMAQIPGTEELAPKLEMVLEDRDKDQSKSYQCTISEKEPDVKAETDSKPEESEEDKDKKE